MKRNVRMVWAMHGAALSVLLAVSALSCGSPPPAPKPPETSQKPASGAEAQGQAERAVANMQAEPAGQTQAKPAGQTQAEPAGQGQAVPAGEGIEELAVKYTLAILPFTGVGREDGETIAELFSFDPTLNKVFAPMPRTSINRAIGREQKFQMGTGMTDPDTVIAIGKQLGAQYVVAGNITSLGNNKLLVISIIRIDKLQQVAGAIQTYTNIEEIQGRLPAMAETIARAVRIDTSKLPGLAIVPFQLRDSTNESDADVLAQILAINIALSGAYAVYPRTATLEQVQDEYANQLAGNTADKNIVAMGKGENPQFVLSGTARKLGSTRNMFNASIIDLASGIQAKGASVNYESIDDGIRAMRRLASDLTGVDLAVYNVNNAETLMDAIADINEDTAENYTITVNMDFVASAITFATNARKTITIRGDARLRTISNIADSALFTLPDGITLVLGNNIRLNGNGKTGRLVEIAKGGTLRMETGATISNGASSGNGGGVYVSGGTFTMSGGTISGNTASYGGGGGGGVFVNSGTFTMSGGTISGNTVSGGYGGGVSVYSSGVFIKTSGTIDGTNSATNGGSVAYVNDSKKRNTTAGPGVTMDSRVAGSAGGWE